MTKTVRKLLGFFLCACLLLSCVPTLAESAGACTLNLHLSADPSKGFDDPSGVTFELFRIAIQDSTTDSGWALDEEFAKNASDASLNGLKAELAAVGDKTKHEYSTDQKARILGFCADVVQNAKPARAGLDTTNASGDVSFSVDPGVYYVRKVGGDDRLFVDPFLASVSTLDPTEQFDVNPKIDYAPETKTSISVKKEWEDDNNYNQERPESVNVQLKRNGSSYRHEVTLDSTNGWLNTWRDLDVTDDNGNPYDYDIEETVVKEGYTGELTKVAVTVTKIWADNETKGNITVNLKADDVTVGTHTLTSPNYTYTWNEKDVYNKETGERIHYTVEAETEEGMDAFHKMKLNASLREDFRYTLTNTYPVKKGALELRKVMTMDNGGDISKANTSVTTYIDGTYHFIIVGPEELEEGKRVTTGDNPNYCDGKNARSQLEITIEKGVMKSPACVEGLTPGTYEVTELSKDSEDGLPEGMEARHRAGSAKTEKGNTFKVYVQPDTTKDNPTVAEEHFVNDQTTGKLIIHKTVYTARGTRSTTGGTFNFTVKQEAPGTYTTVVPVIVSQGRGSATVDGLAPGKYTVTEAKPTAGYEDPTGENGVTKTLTVKAGDTAASISFDIDNHLTPTPTPAPTPTPTTRTGGGGGGGTTTIVRTPVPVNTNTPTPTPSDSTPPDETPEVTPSNTPGETPTPSPTPVPTPTPTPVTSVTISKVWDDENNVHRTRPANINVQLLQNGVMVNSATMTGTGNNWSYTFSNLPAVDAKGVPYEYTAREIQVSGYTTELNGTVIVNHLIPVPPSAYTNFNGRKIWRDNDDASGRRPGAIVVRLLRDGVEDTSITVTALNDWQYSFDHVPVDDGYGNIYNYELREDPVEGYFTLFEGYDVINVALPEEEELEEFRGTGTPLAGFPGLGESELEELFELYDYEMPLWGEPMKTGDELPLYPIIFGGIGLTALLALLVLSSKERKKKRMGA